MFAKQAKELRKRIDFCIKETERHLGADKDSPAYKNIVRPLSLVKTKLQEAKMWAGKVLEAMGQELPEEFKDEWRDDD